ncbi:MAG: cytochrome P460 family protein [Thermoleophilia bacterium]
MRDWRRGLIATAAAAAVAAGAAACGGGDDGTGDAGSAPPPATTAPAASAPAATTAPEPRPAPRPRALPGLPAWTAGFARWDTLNSAPIPQDSAQTQRVGFDAHSSVKDVYVRLPAGASRPAAGEPWPDGTDILKAGRRDGAVVLIAVMRKVAGSDPDHGDWEFREWLRDSAGEDFATEARLTGATCWGCHATAAETDWVFTPDEGP